MPLKTAGNIRRKFKIKGHEWRVIYVRNLTHPEHGPCAGDCDPDTRTISIEWQLKPEVKFRTFFHELMHAIAFESHATEAGGVHGILGELIAEGSTDVILKLFELEWAGTRRKKVKS
jgi:hypothetical protein